MSSSLSLSPQHNSIPQSSSTQQSNSSQQKSSAPQSSSLHQLHREHPENVLSVQETTWVDATSNEGLEDIQDIRRRNDCDIQRIASRLVRKA